MSELFVYDAIHNGSRRRDQNAAIAALCPGMPLSTSREAQIVEISDSADEVVCQAMFGMTPELTGAPRRLQLMLEARADAVRLR